MGKTEAKKIKNWLFQNIANFITVFGLVAAFWHLAILIYSPETLWLIIILSALIGLTDFIDGKVARHFKINSRTGSALDRLRDKILICPLLIMLAWQTWPLNKSSMAFATLTIGLALLLVLIELILFGAWLIGLFKNLDISANKYGKIKMFLQFAVVMIWLSLLTAEKYFSFPELKFSIYLIDFLLIITIYFAVKSLEGYYKRYTA